MNRIKEKVELNRLLIIQQIRLNNQIYMTTSH